MHFKLLAVPHPKHLLSSLIIAGMTSINLPAQAGIVKFDSSVKQFFAGSQSPDDARIAGLKRAKREGLEKVGSYIESNTLVENFQVVKDEIVSLYAGIVSAEIIAQQMGAEGNAFFVDLTISLSLDDEILQKRIEEYAASNRLMAELKKQQQKNLLLESKYEALLSSLGRDFV